MASPENATSVSLRPEGVDAEGRKIPGQKEILVAWKEEKLFRLSPFVRDCLEILERHPELLDTARPGLELSSAIVRADSMAIFIEAVQELRDDQGMIDPETWDELRDDLLTRGAPHDPRR